MLKSITKTSLKRKCTESRMAIFFILIDKKYIFQDYDSLFLQFIVDWEVRWTFCTDLIEFVDALYIRNHLPALITFQLIYSGYICFVSLGSIISILWCRAKIHDYPFFRFSLLSLIGSGIIGRFKCAYTHTHAISP